MKTSFGAVYLDSFIMFPEYFIGVSGIYVLIVIVLITYNIYGLMLQRAVSDCMALIMFMACYLLLNDDLLCRQGLAFHNSVENDSLAFFTKFIVCASSAIFFLIISNFLKKHRLTSFEYLFVLLFAVLGLVLLCSSNDLLTAYLALELTSLASYILASFKKSSHYSIDSGLKYFVTGALSSAFFLLGSSFIYGVTGTINFLELNILSDTKTTFQYFYPFVGSLGDLGTAGQIPVHIYVKLFFHWLKTGQVDTISFESSLAELGLYLIMLSLFIKLGLAPFHLWSLDVYEGSPTISTFFFAVISKLSIFVLLLRLCYKTLISFSVNWFFFPILVAVISIFVGSFGGLKTRKIKTLLAYSSISHMGYILLAFTSEYWFMGIDMILFYLIIYIISGLGTWFIILSLKLKNKNVSNKYSLELGDLALLHKANPALALTFSLTLFSLAGIPPLIGFMAKIGIFIVAIANEFFIPTVIAILCSVVSTFYYIRVIKVLYFENVLVGKLYYPIKNQKILILSLLTFLLVFLFINPTLLYLVILKTMDEFLTF